METKVCTICSIEKELSGYYLKNKKLKDGSQYVYCPPYCKECTSKKSQQWQKNNIERKRESCNKWKVSESGKSKNRVNNRKYLDSGKFKEWQQNNPDKIKEYNLKRKMNKEHDITEQEWLECLDFFNDSCAYCGISEEQALKEYGQQLHKEHVEHNGSNDITNCVPACRSCNSQKWEFEFNEWYNGNNPVFSKRRYNKIIKWLLSFATVK